MSSIGKKTRLNTGSCSSNLMNSENEERPKEKQSQSRSIVVTGQGRAVAKPTHAELRLGVSSEAGSAKEALAKNSESTKRVMDALSALSIPQSEIETAYFMLSPKYSPQRSRLEGLEALHMLVVTTEKTNEVGEIIDKAVEAGANRIDRVTFTVKKEELTGLENEARKRAVEDAEKRAETIASSLGLRIEGASGAAEDAHTFVEPQGRAMNIASYAIAPPAEQEIRVSVRVTFTAK